MNGTKGRQAARRCEAAGFVWVALSDPALDEVDELSTAFDLPHVAVQHAGWRNRGHLDRSAVTSLLSAQHTLRTVASAVHQVPWQPRCGQRNELSDECRIARGGVTPRVVPGGREPVECSAGPLAAEAGDRLLGRRSPPCYLSLMTAIRSPARPPTQIRLFTSMAVVPSEQLVGRIAEELLDVLQLRIHSNDFGDDVLADVDHEAVDDCLHGRLVPGGEEVAVVVPVDVVDVEADRDGLHLDRRRAT